MCMIESCVYTLLLFLCIETIYAFVRNKQQQKTTATGNCNSKAKEKTNLKSENATTKATTITNNLFILNFRKEYELGKH